MVAYSKNGGILKTVQFSTEDQIHVTEAELLPQDIFPLEKLPEVCRWAHNSILSVMWAFYRSRYFMLRAGAGFENFGRRTTIEIIAVNRGMHHRISQMVVEVSIYHLKITIQSTEIPVTVQKRWHHGYTKRPKWKKFGTYACNALFQRQLREEVFEVMES